MSGKVQEYTNITDNGFIVVGSGKKRRTTNIKLDKINSATKKNAQKMNLKNTKENLANSEPAPESADPAQKPTEPALEPTKLDTDPFSYANILKKNSKKDFIDITPKTLMLKSNCDKEFPMINKKVVMIYCMYGLNCKHRNQCNKFHHIGEVQHFDQLIKLESLGHKCKYGHKCRQLRFCGGHTDLEYNLSEMGDIDRKHYKFSKMDTNEFCFNSYMCKVGVKCTKRHLPGEIWQFRQDKLINEEKRCIAGLECKQIKKCNLDHTDLEKYLSI